VLPPEENGPCNAARILALKEKAFGLAILEPEDFAVSPNVEFTLLERRQSVGVRFESRQPAALLSEEGEA
jgi:hypothetical protein